MKQALLCVYVALQLMFLDGCSNRVTVVKAQLVEAPPAAETVDSLRARQEEYDARIRDGLILFRQEEFEAAAEQFREAVAIDNRSWQPYYFLGLVAMEQGQPHLALGLLEESLDCSPPEDRARSRVYLAIAEAFESLGQWDRAEVNYRTALNLYPGSSTARAALDRLSGQAPGRRR